MPQAPRTSASTCAAPPSPGVARPPRTPGRSRSERSAETGQSRSASARAAWRSSPPPPRPGRPRAPDLLLQLLEEGCDVDVAVRRNPCKLAIFCALIGHRRIVPGTGRGIRSADARGDQPADTRARRGRRVRDVRARPLPGARGGRHPRVRSLHASGCTRSGRRAARGAGARVPASRAACRSAPSRWRSRPFGRDGFGAASRTSTCSTTRSRSRVPKVDAPSVVTLFDLQHLDLPELFSRVGARSTAASHTRARRGMPTPSSSTASSCAGA